MCRQVKCRAGWPRFLLSISPSPSFALSPIACGSGAVCVRVSVGSGCARVCHSWRSSFSLSRARVGAAKRAAASFGSLSLPLSLALSRTRTIQRRPGYIAAGRGEIVCLGYDERWYTGLSALAGRFVLLARPSRTRWVSNSIVSFSHLIPLIRRRVARTLQHTGASIL